MMKLKLKLSLIGLAFLGLTASSAYAGITASAGNWVGHGTSYGEDGKEDGKYQIELTNTQVSDHEVDTKGTVTLSDGKTIAFSQKMVDTERGFSIVSDTGKGGGYCFADDLCQAYVESEGGQAIAISIVIDGKDAMRFVGTRLESGKAVGFFSEKLSRKQ